MADEQNPAPVPDSSPGFTAPSSLPRPSANVNGAASDSPLAPSVPGSDGFDGKTGQPHASEITLIGRWLGGLLLVLVCGWGILGLALYLILHYHVRHPEWVFGILAALDLGLFLFLERDFWLSHFMGLRIEPGSHFWQSAIMLWLLGALGLVFRPTNFHGEALAESGTLPKTRTRPQPAPRSDSVREVVETIVFVVVLVLLLKSFAAEAFVIPTGSMAQTLLGYQKEVVCPDCGIKFPINCSQEVDPSEGGKPSSIYACVCPNCRQRIHFPSAPLNYVQSYPSSMPIEDPGWNSGDRVLVAKFVYDLLGKTPDRLDVVVFKYPGDNSFPATGPHKNHVPMNYIKRLIGLPGETIAIYGGKLYYLSPDKGLSYDDYEKALRDPELMATLWQKDNMHCNAPEAADRFKNHEFQIIRKSPDNILSMMRLVYDNDHPSKDRSLPPRWSSADGVSWAAHQPHGFRLEGGQPDETYWLRYQHLLRESPKTPALIMDIMGYNTYQGGPHHGEALLGRNWVGDLIMECEASIENPQGELTLELSRGVDRFRARWDLASGVCTLFRLHQDNREQQLESKQTAMNKKGTYRLRFANVDQRLCVWVDGELPFDNGIPYEAPKQVGPTRENDLEPARIGVKGGGVAVHKLKLFRDTYYTVGGGCNRGGGPSDPDVTGLVDTDPHTWRDFDPPLLTMYVQPDHFLCLGDNSPESSDGRTWGAVPKRLLLGRALLVYYPFGRAGRIR